jgi:hypothetical protein
VSPGSVVAETFVELLAVHKKQIDLRALGYDFLQAGCIAYPPAIVCPPCPCMPSLLVLLVLLVLLS